MANPDPGKHEPSFADERPPSREAPPRRRLGGSDWAAIAIGVLLLAGLAAWWLRQDRDAARPPPPELATAPAPAAAPAPEPDAPPPDPARARTLLEEVSGDPDFRRWSAGDDLVDRWALVTDNLAEGVSPRRPLEALAPERPFSVEARGERQVIAQAAYARYDRVANVIASVDAAAAARLYRALHRPLEAAYRALGYPGGSLDAVTARALARLERAPVRDGDVEVVPEGGLWAYADPALEALGEADKHLLRMGPRNGRIVQAKARALREALRLPAPP